MRLAQQLYEGVDFGEGAIGLITYMRTDSVNLADEAVKEIREVAARLYGQAEVAEEPRVYKTKSKNAQEAHEAIRPTSAAIVPATLEGKIDPDQFRLYSLIWKRAVASQMSHAVFDTVAVDMLAGPDGPQRHMLRANGSTLVKPGFMSVYQEGADDVKTDDDDHVLPAMNEGDKVALADFKAAQHFTEPPPRYSEASLVKALEEHGIGRPSTYATIISTLQDREYVEMDSRRFIPTDIGKIVGRFLTQHFHRYVEYGFTAALEDELDAVSRGEEEWTIPLSKFWKPFVKEVENVEKNVSREQVAMAREIGTDPVSGKPMSVRMGQYGPFVQIGTKDDEEKPKFAGLRPGQKMDTITMEQALELFQLPRKLGQTAEGEDIVTNVGRFGPYVKYGAKYVSLKEGDDPYTVQLRAGARADPPEAGSGCKPHHCPLRERRHSGAERPFRPVHHRRQEEREDPEGSGSEEHHPRRSEGDDRTGARARHGPLRSLRQGQARRRGRQDGQCAGGGADGEKKAAGEARCPREEVRVRRQAGSCRRRKLRRPHAVHRPFQRA